MQTKQWDIVSVRILPTDRDRHPAIIFSPDEVASKCARVSVFYGSTKRPSRGVEPGQIVLNGADGLDHMTVFDVSQIFMIEQASIQDKLGEVSHERRRALKRLVISVYRLL